MAEDAVSSRTPNIYRLTHTIVIEEVDKKNKEAKCIESAPFFCRHDPQPAIFVLGMRWVNGWFSVSFKPLHQNVTVRYAAFTLRDHTGALLKKYVGERENTNGGQQVYEKDVFIGYSQFHQPTEAACGTWRLVVDLEYEGSFAINKDNPKETGSGSSLQIQTDLLEVLATSKAADVTFLVKDEKIRAHRLILTARSSYYAKLFQSDMEESRSNEVEVTDTEPEVFKGMLEFLYSGLPPKNLSDIAMNLLSAADKYQLEDLADLCESNIASNLTAANIVDALLLADRHNRRDLLTRVTAAFRAQYRFLKESKEATDKLKTNPDLLLKLLESFLE